MTTGPSRRAVTLAVASSLALGLSSCSGESATISQQARQGDNKGYVAGDGAIEKLTADQRKGPVTVSGTLMDGRPWSLGEHRGKVVVLNIWGAWCGPCQRELPHLQRAWVALQKSGTVMLGLNQRDSVAAAQATLRKFAITYPSLRDDGGQSLLGLQGKVATYPTTLVLDTQGRIAARISGETTETTLRTLVGEVGSERATT